MLDIKFWKSVGIDVVACYRRHIFDPDGHGVNAKDIHGNDYKDYSTYPSKWAAIGMKESAKGLIPKGGISYADAKKTGQMKKQASKFKGSNAPVLTSDLARDFKWTMAGANTKGFGFGNVAQKGKVKNLAKMGRVIYTDTKPLPKKCAELLMDEMTKDVKGAFKKIRKRIKRKKININIGK